MKLHQLFEAYVHPSVEGSTLTAYHCGNTFEGNFDFRYSGHGEGARILGPGMYLITNEYIAQNYAKYANTEPMMYTCEVRIDNFYDIVVVPSERMAASMNAISKELGYDDYSQLPQAYESLKYGRGFIGKVVKLVGHKAAQPLFVKHGIKGSLEFIDRSPSGDIWEMAVFDLSCVKIVDRKPTTVPDRKW